MPDLACELSSGLILDFAGEASTAWKRALAVSSTAPIDANAANEKINRSNSVHIARLRRSRTGFGGDQIPVWIARRNLSSESPNIGDAGNRVCTAIDHIAVTIASHRHQLGDKAQRKLRHFATQLCIRDFSRIDRYKTGLDSLAPRFALANHGFEPVIDFACQ